MTLAAKPREVNAQERSRRARRLLVQAPLWAPSMSERDIFLEGIPELPDLWRDGARTVAGAGGLRAPALANAAGIFASLSITGPESIF